jgi:shikimate kinase
MKNIVLIGFRGTGKSTLSQELALRLRRVRISTDDLATERCGMSITDFVREHGWSEFRRIETECIASLQGKAGYIIDSGGGVVESPDNMRLLGEHGVIVWIHASLEDVVTRLIGNTDDAQRPLLSEGDFRSDITENYTRREPLYKQYADFSVNTSTHTIQECSAAIEQWLVASQATQ